jgi:hypothetical protein
VRGWENLQTRSHLGLARHAQPGSILYAAWISDVSHGRAGLAIGLPTLTGLRSERSGRRGKEQRQGWTRRSPALPCYAGLGPLEEPQTRGDPTRCQSL